MVEPQLLKNGKANKWGEASISDNAWGPILDVGEANGAKIDEEQIDEDKHDQFLLSWCRVSAFTKVISLFSLE